VLFDMEAIALKRGFIQSGKRIDYERTGRAILDEFRAGIIGNITLERPVLK
jgi:ribosome biogenesis GTP-binding protein ylqF